MLKLFGNILAKVTERIERLSCWIVNESANLLPHELRDRCVEEWLADLDTVKSSTKKLYLALGLRYAAQQISKDYYSQELAHSSTRSSFKRGVDIFGALVGLLVLCVILPLIAIAVRLDSNGPTLVSQERLGLQGMPFRIWKIRTTVVNANKSHDRARRIESSPHSIQITRVGYFLRKTSLDELPQFWNVLVGDMSLVGTRPPTEKEAECYEKHHFRRLNVRPGLTGQWQISEDARGCDFERVVELDLEYQDRWTPLHDLQIILRTVAIVFEREDTE